jgi:hypothetical protein
MFQSRLVRLASGPILLGLLRGLVCLACGLSISASISNQLPPAVASVVLDGQPLKLPPAVVASPLRSVFAKGDHSPFPSAVAALRRNNSVRRGDIHSVALISDG